MWCVESVIYEKWIQLIVLFNLHRVGVYGSLVEVDTINLFIPPPPLTQVTFVIYYIRNICARTKGNEPIFLL